MSGTSTFLRLAARSLPLLAAALVASPAFSADENLGTIEEIVVTSEKRETTSQDAALALSAFDENALDRENIDDALDIQFSVPNLLYSKGNFTGSNVAIRGIGNSAVGASADGGTGVHFDGVYLVAPALFESEFYDLARVEVLRGPQGTLYGRNTTAGVINIIPNKPSKEFDAMGEMEFGDYNTTKYKSAVNLPLAGIFQVRTSLFRLKRDGYVLNEATGNAVDDRDVVAGRLAFRLGGEADSPFELNIIYDHFLEEDKRLRQSKQVCHTDRSPYPHNIGCLPGQSLYEGDRFGSPTTFSTIAGFLGSIQPAAGLAAAMVTAPPSCANPIPGLCTFYPSVPFVAFPAGIPQPGIEPNYNPESLRAVNQIIDPFYKLRDRLGTVNLKWDLGGIEFYVLGGRQRRSYYTNNDYNGSSGPNGTPAPFNPVAVATWNGVLQAQAVASGATALASAIAAATQAGVLFSNDPILTGNGQSTNGHSGLFAWDASFTESDGESGEFRVVTDFNGWFNFLIGAFQLDHESSSGYQVHSNLLATFSVAAPELGYYHNHTDLYELDSEATFAEFYLGGENFKLTLGVRNTQETKKVRDRQTLLNSPTLAPIDGLTGRACMNSPIPGVWRVAGWGSGGICLNNAVPNFATRSRTWDEDTWKFGMDIRISPDSLMYITSASSYKSGGLNPPAFTGAFPADFAPEYIDSLEIGFKNSIGGKANVNLTFFHYDYTGLQVSKIVDRTSVNENVDAINQGIELEIAWAPTRNWRFDLTASRLHTEIQGGSSINPTDPANAYTDGTAGDARFLNTKNGDASIYLLENPNAASPYVFNPDDCGTKMEGGTLECGNIFSYRPTGTGDGSVRNACILANVCTQTSTEQDAANWLTGLSAADQLKLAVTCPAASVGAAIVGLGNPAFTDPAVVGAAACAGTLPATLTPTTQLFTQVPIGIAVDLAGNQLANAPEQSARLGMQYNIDLDGTTLALRADYYWQSDFYYRIFNTPQDLVESWNVLNLQASLTSLTGDWTMEVWVKNARNDDFVTGGYVTDASSGNFTNLFLLEPRTVGVSFRFRY